MANKDIEAVGDYFRKRWGSGMNIVDKIRDALTPKRPATMDMLKELYGMYVEDMDYYSVPVERRTSDNFGKWMYGNLSMPAEDRYIPADTAVWEQFTKTVKWGNQIEEERLIKEGEKYKKVQK